MATNGRRKGHDFERKIALLLREYGYEDARRGQQYSGANGDADVVGLDGIHIECKAVEKLILHDAIAQAKRDAREDELPVVIHKKSRKPILVSMEFDTFMKLYQKGVTK